MRRLSFNRPNEKVRNPERHLRALERWAKGFEGYYPVRGRNRYQNYKIWTLDRLVEGSRAKPEWKREAIVQLLNAAESLRKAKPDYEEGKSWVAVLLCYPNLWSSEVTVFFDPDYLNSFIPKVQNDISLLHRFDIRCPESFLEKGYSVSWEDEDCNPPQITEERYTIFESSLEHEIHLSPQTDKSENSTS